MVFRLLGIFLPGRRYGEINYNKEKNTSPSPHERMPFCSKPPEHAIK